MSIRVIRGSLFFLVLFAVYTLEAAVRPNILLITIDTLRADHLGCYGSIVNASPALDQFAKEAVRFERAYSAVPLTLPSHATILTGLYPKNHGIRDNAHFPLKGQLIQESLKAAGYQTAAFVSGETLSARFGLNGGFHFYDDEFAGLERNAEETTMRAIAWLKTARRPYFLWVHYFDPHAEYEPPQEFRARFSKSLYDGEIAFVDTQIARLLAATGKEGFTVITADHGESLGEHGEDTHAIFLYNATLHVPLMIRGPGIAAGVRSDPVTLCDIAPTIAKVAGVAWQATDGLSLLQAKQDRTLFAESLYAERNFGYAPLFASIRQKKKFILAPQAEFYDLQRDAKEIQNLFSKSDVSSWKVAAQQYAKEQASPNESKLSSEEKERLRSLGYVSGSSPKTGIDPKTKIQVMKHFNQGLIQLNSQQYVQAERTFQEITQTEQQNAQGFRFLADALAAQRKYAEAVKAYISSFSRLPDPEVGVQLAKAYNRLGDTAQAEKVLLNAVQKFPDYHEAAFELSSFYASQQKWESAFALLKLESPAFHNQRGLIYIQKKEPQNAVAEFTTAIRMQPRATYYNNLAIAYQRQRQMDKAESAYLEALKLNPDDDECEANLAFLLVEQKRWQEALTHLKKITGRNGKLWQARFALGFALEHLQQQREALEVYQKLSAEAPADWPQRAQLEGRIQALSRERRF